VVREALPVGEQPGLGGPDDKAERHPRGNGIAQKSCDDFGDAAVIIVVIEIPEHEPSPIPTASVVARKLRVLSVTQAEQARGRQRRGA